MRQIVAVRGSGSCAFQYDGLKIGIIKSKIKILKYALLKVS